MECDPARPNGDEGSDAASSWHQAWEETALRLHGNAFHLAERFGAWYFVFRYGDEVSDARTRVVTRQAVPHEGWLDTAELAEVMGGLHEHRKALQRAGVPGWRLLLLGGDDSGEIHIETVYDDDPTVDEWVFDFECSVDIVAKAMPILDIWPSVDTYLEHIWSVGMPFRDEARRVAGEHFGTAYGVVGLTDPHHPVLRCQIRTPDGSTHDDWATPELAGVVLHNAARYSRFYRDNGYPDWTTACFAVDDQGMTDFKPMPDAPAINGDLTALVEHARPILDM